MTPWLRLMVDAKGVEGEQAVSKMCPAERSRGRAANVTSNSPHPPLKTHLQPRCKVQTTVLSRITRVWDNKVKHVTAMRLCPFSSRCYAASCEESEGMLLPGGTIPIHPLESCPHRRLAELELASISKSKEISFDGVGVLNLHYGPVLYLLPIRCPVPRSS